MLHGESLAGEVRLLIRGGCSLGEAIQAATDHGAALLGCEQELGRMEIGKPAHFLVARGTPAQLPRKLSYLEGIYLHGRPCSSALYQKV
ncbi:amidohydrolase family protein [Desulfogranum mediterraneum]|uniref:amidohydrolase family protein n=1 Tax=Desulfogranum mediterraneum TaxID=160661 RepID=UPI00040AB2C3|nr:amidohydrolase family protein [Desulfogranum mediterraneum]